MELSNLTDMVQEFVKYLDRHSAVPNDEHELTLRISKIAEEAGEAIAARINWTGQNPRKERMNGNDVIIECCDVIFTSLTVMLSIFDDPVLIERVLHERFNYILRRVDKTEENK